MGWSTIFTMAVVGNTSHDTDDRNARTVVSADDISASATKIRITLEAHASVTKTLDGCSIGERDPGTDDMTDTPTRIQFSESDSIELTAGQTFVSDEVTYTLDSTKDQLIHFWFDDGYAMRYSTVDGGGYYWVSGSGQSDLTLEQTVSMGSLNGEGVRTLLVSKIEEYTSDDLSLSVSECEK